PERLEGTPLNPRHGHLPSAGVRHPVPNLSRTYIQIVKFLTKTLRVPPLRNGNVARGDAKQVERGRLAEPGVGLAAGHDRGTGDEFGGDDVVRVGRFAVEVDPPGALLGAGFRDVLVETVGVEVVAVPGGPRVEVVVGDAEGVGFAGEGPGGVEV